jgi:regulator of sigma E protease
MLVWLAPIIVFGLVVLVHELGHFMAAKLVGVYAPRFSIGFGRPIWRRRKGETEFVIGMLPLGGYVRMASREDEATAFIEGGSEVSSVPAVGANDGPAVVGEDHKVSAPRKDWDPDAMIPFGPKPVPEHRWFESKPLLARLFILIAGVAMNAVLAIVVSTGVFAAYGKGYIPAVIDSVVPGRPAMAAGFSKGDSIARIDGQAVRTWTEVLDIVGRAPNREIAIDVVRDNGQATTLRVTPEALQEPNPVSGRMEQVGRIGAAPERRVIRESVGAGEAIAEGWNGTWRMAGAVLQVVGGLVTGKVSVSQLGGPIEIARTSVQAARSGLEDLLALLAFLSINVAILNLLPIPLLDGGQILMNVAESIKGSAFSTRTREYIMRAGLVAIGMLFVLVMFNDLKKTVLSWLG